jgi:hypothetical protein
MGWNCVKNGVVIFKVQKFKIFDYEIVMGMHIVPTVSSMGFHAAKIR